MVPMAGGSSQGAMTRVTVKTDQEILQLAIKDISVVRDALSSEAPVKKLKTAKNLMKAYGEFMKKGRIEGSHPRTWEKEPASEVLPCNNIACARGLSTLCGKSQSYTHLLLVAALLPRPRDLQRNG